MGFAELFAELLDGRSFVGTFETSTLNMKKKAFLFVTRVVHHSMACRTNDHSVI